MEEVKIYDEIINSDMFKREKKYIQHGNYSVYDHSINVAKACYSFVKKFNLNIEMESLIKGALLHDYFLYDWHEKEAYHRLHGVKHPRFSRNNAMRDFGLNKKEENMILSHMFPLGYYSIPKYKESIILWLVDKHCATKEIILSSKTYQKLNGFKTKKIKN